jgi:MFS family permease
LEHHSNYRKGFLPYAVAAAVLSLCGGLAAAVPPNIVVDWGLEETMVTWLSMGYSLGAAVAAPIMGKLSDLLGRRTTLLLGLAMFAVGSFMVAITPVGAVLWLLFFRFFTGVGGSAIAPVVMAYIMTDFPKEKLGQGFMLYMVLSCGMVIFGPAVGGILLSRAGWRIVIFVCMALAAVAWIICLLLVKKHALQRRENTKFDYVGAVFVVIFFSMLLAIPTFGQSNGWRAVSTVISIGIGILSLILLILTERKAQNPILNGKFMARKQFVLPVVVLFLSQGLLQSCMTNIITFSIVTTGDRTLSGIATSIMYVGMALGTVIISPLADKKEPRTIAALALVFVAAGAALQMLFTVSTSLLLMCASMFLIGLGLGGNGTIFLKVVLSGLPPETAGSGSGTYNVFRDMSAPFGVALFVPMFSTGLASGTKQLITAGVAEAEAKARAAVTALHSTAIVQVLCIAACIAVCLLLPKIYQQKKPL